MRLSYTNFIFRDNSHDRVICYGNQLQHRTELSRDVALSYVSSTRRSVALTDYRTNGEGASLAVFR